jgi:hypothetical protein
VQFKVGFVSKPEIFKILPNVFQNIACEMVQRGKNSQFIDEYKQLIV